MKELVGSKDDGELRLLIKGQLLSPCWDQEEKKRGQRRFKKLKIPMGGNFFPFASFVRKQKLLGAGTQN